MCECFLLIHIKRVIMWLVIRRLLVANYSASSLFQRAFSLLAHWNNTLEMYRLVADRTTEPHEFGAPVIDSADSLLAVR